jgi:transcriptional regulator with XRE-family HTH domain
MLKRSVQRTDAVPEVEVEESGRGLLIIDEQGDALPTARHRRSNVVSLHGRAPSATDAAVELGERLRRTREARGLSVEDVAAVLKFRSDYVEALERGEVRELPVTYAVGFLRSYAEFLGGSALGIDIPEAVSRVKHGYEHPRGDGRGMWGFAPENAMPKLSLLIVAGLLALGVFVAWELSQDPSLGEASGAATYHGQLATIARDR